MPIDIWSCDHTYQMPNSPPKLLFCLLGRAWASPTLAWLHCAHACVCLLACLDRPLTVNFKWAHSNISQGLTVHGKMYTSAKPWEWEWTVTSISVKLSGSKDDSSSVRLHHTQKHLVWRQAKPLIHSRDPPVSSRFECEASPRPCSHSSSCSG